MDGLFDIWKPKIIYLILVLKHQKQGCSQAYQLPNNVELLISLDDPFIPKRVKFVKFFGLLLHEHLTWKYHLTELSQKFASTCGVFFRIWNLLPLDALICLYNALFLPLPFIQYGIIAWGQTYASYIDPIFKLQKKQSELSHFSLAWLPLFRF